MYRQQPNSQFLGDIEKKITDDLLLPHGHIANGDQIFVSRLGVFGQRRSKLLVFWFFISILQFDHGDYIAFSQEVV